MKRMFGNWLKAGLMVMGLAGFAHADLKWTSGEWEFNLPFISNMDGIGAYDVINKVGLIGGESVVLSYKGFEATATLLTTADVFDGEIAGTLAGGVRRQIPKWGVHVGIFLGRDFRENIYRGGIKATKGFFGRRTEE